MGQFSDISSQMSVIPLSQEIQVYFTTWRHGVKSALPSVVTNLHQERRSLTTLATNGSRVAVGKCMNSERSALKGWVNKK